MSFNGILLIATQEKYIRAANGLARSVRKVMPEMPIDIHCDLPEFLQRELFSNVELIEDGHRRSKVDRLPLTRFDRTLYLDTDIRVIEDISHLFALMDRFDLAIAHAHARNRTRTLEKWQTELPESFPQYNGGVILYNSAKSDVISFFKDWQNAFHESGFNKDQVTLRELLWNTELRLHTLPPEYNVRYEKYLKIWDEQEARPQILHFPQYKNEHEQYRGKISTGIINEKNGLSSKDFKRLLNPANLFASRRKKEKVFCIGFHKTGTTSLSKALRILGYNTIHGDGSKTWAGADEGRTLTKMIDSGDFELPTLSLFDAFSDNPYFSMWRELDKTQKGKFILTKRDPEKWIDSCCRFYKDRRVRHMRQWMFGEHADPNSSPQARQAWLDRYNKHNSEIIEHFGDRDDFLILNIADENPWTELCAFLGKKTPRKPFPHVNKTKVK